MTKTYTKGQLFERLKNNNTPKSFFLFAGEGYIPKKSNFTIYQEFDNLSDFLHNRQLHIENGLNVLSFAF